MKFPEFMPIKPKLIFAFIFFLVGLWYVVDWIVFSVYYENKGINSRDIPVRYFKRLPLALQPIFQGFILSTCIFILLFSIAGIVFIKEDSKIFKAIGVVSFILGFWQLFSLM